ncbi:hypothetical protein CO661_25875 [Sinorhizobium fredii]|uniref:DUF3396 domain-containing protein n=1 Tax=Rhizobium fredii TaxID=380 RepID=A0A2A6LR94_RHIFR|nr:hypothetical protein CO661_25875 [Sinorhizobium fredii]
MQYPLDLKLDPEDIEHRGILRDDDVRLIRSRVGILLSIYFADGWSQEKREALITCLGDYLSFFSSEVTHFQVDDEPKMRAYKEGGVPDEYRCLLDLPETDSLFVYLKQADTAEPWDPSRLMFMGFGHRKSKVWPSSGIEVHFSPRFVFENTDRFVGLVRNWSQRLEAVHGSCGLGVLSDPGSENSADAYYYPWLMQYPALEYDAMGSFWTETQNGGSELPRSSNWLTILGNANVERLGGLEAIRAFFARLPHAISELPPAAALSRIRR